MGDKSGELTRSHEPLESLLVLNRFTHLRLCFSNEGTISVQLGELNINPITFGAKKVI